MAPRTLIVLLLALIALAGGAGILLLETPAVDDGFEDEVGVVPEPVGIDPGIPPPIVASPPSGSRSWDGRLEVDGEAPRVAVLPAGGALPPREGAEEDPFAALRGRTLRGAPGRQSGIQLLHQVGDVVYVRFRSKADMDAVCALPPDPDWPSGEPLPLAEVVEHWRRQGFEVEPLGHVLLVRRMGD